MAGRGRHGSPGTAAAADAAVVADVAHGRFDAKPIPVFNAGGTLTVRIITGRSGLSSPPLLA